MQPATNFLRTILNAGLDMLLPPRCPSCRVRIEEHGHICASCWASLSVIADPKCNACGIPFAHEQDGLTCGACLASPPAYDKAIAPVLYEDKGRDLVLGLKHGRLFSAAPAMARLMAGHLTRTIEAEKDYLFVPVPLHPTRLMARRFNQSQILAEALSEQTDIPMDAVALTRTRRTTSQGGLKKSGRLKNVKGAFAVADKHKATIVGKTILLVDDVLTTGATAGACAHALKNAGASAVIVVAFARVGEPLSG